MKGNKSIEILQLHEQVDEIRSKINTIEYILRWVVIIQGIIVGLLGVAVSIIMKT